MTRERVGMHLNRALHQLFDRDDGLYLLGQDVTDPYGGAFKVTKGLSSRYPDRVLSTPISESATLGVASGLALCGHRVVVEVMFGDFLALAFDQLLNFTTKSVAMYGRTTPMRVVIRCPVGGNRGYGPTHSQSPQKHLIGIPFLSLYELSAFHDATRLLGEMLDLGRPAILFEDKVLYGQWRPTGGRVDDTFQYEFLDHAENWVRMFASRVAGPSVVAVAAGGMVTRMLKAARRLRDERINLEVLVPARLYPIDLDSVLHLLTGADAVCVAEESTEGGTWGAEVSRLVYERAWDRLRQPIRTISSRDNVIPAARHLEQRVVVQADTICATVRAMTATPTTAAAAPRASQAVTPAPDLSEPNSSGPHSAVGPAQAADLAHPIVLPRLNANDESYVLVEWLKEDGARVREGEAVAVVETAKATEEILAGTTGLLRHQCKAGVECQPGAVLGYVVADGDGRDPDRPLAGAAFLDRVFQDRGIQDRGAQDAARIHVPSQVQRAVATAVTNSRRDIPAAFVVLRVEVDSALAALRRHGEQAGAAVGLPELLVKALGALRARFPLCFGSRRPDGTVELPDATHVAVTVDAGNGLFLPVLRDVDRCALDDLADRLMEFRLKAVRGDFRAEELAGANIALSVNHEAGVLIAQPIVPPGLVCVLAVGGLRPEIDMTETGQIVRRQTVHLGLAYDHRVVNGREAILVLQALRDLLAAPQALLQGGTAGPGRDAPATAATSADAEHVGDDGGRFGAGQ